MVDSRDFTSETIEKCDVSLAEGIESVYKNKDMRYNYSKKGIERVRMFNYEIFREKNDIKDRKCLVYDDKK